MEKDTASIRYILEIYATFQLNLIFFARFFIY